MSTQAVRINKQLLLSDCFSKYKDMLSSRVHDAGLQNELQVLLFHQWPDLDDDALSINFGDKASVWLISKSKIISKCLSDFLDEADDSDKGRSSLKENNTRISRHLLESLGVNNVTALVISFFLDLVSKEFNADSKLIQLHYFTKFGAKIVELYVLQSYTTYCKDNKNNTSRLSLSDWKFKYSVDYDLESLYKPETLFAIGGILTVYLTISSANMIELTIEYDHDDHKQDNIIKVVKEARDIMVSDNNIIHIVPAKLPMIVKPKPYKLLEDNKWWLPKQWRVVCWIVIHRESFVLWNYKDRTF